MQQLFEYSLSKHPIIDKSLYSAKLILNANLPTFAASSCEIRSGGASVRCSFNEVKYNHSPLMHIALTTNSRVTILCSNKFLSEPKKPSA